MKDGQNGQIGQLDNLTDGVGIGPDLKSGALALAKHSGHSFSLQSEGGEGVARIP